MKTYLSEAEISDLVEVIKTAESYSTGEIRVHIDSSTDEPDNEQLAWDVFEKLEMFNTKDRNAVLFHVNFNQRYFTIIGDKGIHDKVCQNFWDKVYGDIIKEFKEGNFYEGLKNGILATGIELKKYFPAADNNPNELSDDITFS